MRTLKAVKEELCHPFQDKRGDWLVTGGPTGPVWIPNGPLQPERLFELLSAETLESLAPGKLTLARATRWDRGGPWNGHVGKVSVVLQCGLDGFIEESKVSDKWAEVPLIQLSQDPRDNQPDLPMRLGGSPPDWFSVVVVRVDAAALLVEVACSGKLLREADHKTILQHEQEEKERNAPHARSYAKRRIAHPHFKNASFEQVA